MEIELASLYGQEIYTDKGMYVGRVEDVNVDITEKRISGFTVRDLNPDAFDVGNKKGVIIPYRWVMAIGDIVLIKHVTRRIVMNKEQKAEGGGKEGERSEQ